MTARPGPAAPGDGPQPVDWWSAASLRLHATLLVGVAVCIAAGLFELGRARAGHTVAWVYTVEWPMFAVMGCFVWWRLLHPRPADDATGRSTGPIASTGGTAAPADPALAAWQDYLDRLHAVDPPGGPPGR
jgi:hypothetical protein